MHSKIFIALCLCLVYFSNQAESKPTHRRGPPRGKIKMGFRGKDSLALDDINEPPRFFGGIRGNIRGGKDSLALDAMNDLIADDVSDEDVKDALDMIQRAMLVKDPMVGTAIMKAHHFGRGVKHILTGIGHFRSVFGK